jgi:hypothetical protein
MAAKSVVIGCKLPHGIVLEHPMDPKVTVAINGKNKAVIIGAEYATTTVDGDFWEQWSAVNKEFPAVRSGAIFVAKSVADAAAIADEFKERKTGFEAMRTDGKDDRAAGVKSADNEE